MNLKRLLAITFSIILSCIVFLPAAMANTWNQATEMKFSEPVAIPGEVLPAGTYWFALANEPGRQVVQISSADHSKVYATVLTEPTDRTKATSQVQIQFAERRHNRPEALLKWYYPGDLTGHEFIYPARSETRLMLDAKQNVIAPTLNPDSIAVPGA